MPKASRPNILYIHTHDIGRYIQPYGYAVPTPNLQAFAEQGVLFRNAFCANPTCSASRATLLTGMYPHNNGMTGLAHRGWSLNDYSQHIVHTLRDAGYTTVLAGVQHVTSHQKGEPWKVIGYDTWLGNQDAEHMASIITRVGTVPQGLDRAALGLDVADFVSHYAAQSLDRFDLSGALNEMTEMIRRYNIMLPARIAMLIKTLVTLEGTARLLNPDFSLVEIMAPYQKKMLWRRFSPARRMRKARRLYSEMEHMVSVLPRGVVDILEQVQSGKFDVHLDHRGLEPSVNRLVLGMLASALFLGSTLLMARSVPPCFSIGWLGISDLSVLGVAGCAVSLALGLRLWRAINKSGRLDRRK